MKISDKGTIKEILPITKADIGCILQGLLIVTVIALIFYNSLAAVPILSPIAVWYVKNRRSRAAAREEQRLAQQFRDGMVAMSFSLNVGYSIENAFREAMKEMVVLYGDDSAIVKEFRAICARMSRNENIEDILDDFASGSKVDDIQYFAEVFRYAKRSGGNLIAISRNTAASIQDKSEVLNEINTLISGKKMEQRIMSIVPFGMVAYLRITSPEFIEPLYGNTVGIIVMTVCLIMYAFSVWLGERITDIKI